MDKRKIVFSLIIGLSMYFTVYAQQIISNPAPKISIQPAPKSVQYSGQSVVFDSSSDKLFVLATSELSKKAAIYLKKMMGEKFDQKIELHIGDENKNGAARFSIHLIHSAEKNRTQPQYYTLDYEEQTNRLTISGSDLSGMIYGVVTLCDLMSEKENKIFLPLYTIKDWPSYKRRIFPAIVEKEDVAPLLDFALKNKIETIALASRNYPWYEVDDRLRGIFAEIKKWKETYGAPELMQMHNIYHEKQINIADEQDVDNLIKVIEAGVQSGLTKIMILADDTPPFKFGEGYILETQSEREKFIHMADAHCYLMNKINVHLEKYNSGIELYYVPAFYTYEEMYYGDMALFKNTPWEKQAFEPLRKDLDYIGQHMSRDIFIIWSGPKVRSRILKKQDLVDWTINLAGRVPFLWDNTIYSQHPFTTTPLFTAFDNDFPAAFDKLTAGNGMYINGDINAEEYRAAMMTTNDYLWNPASYEPAQSILMAISKRYGSQLADVLLELKDVELSIRKMIGERALWFEADTLWQVIRKTRYITGKNPWYYHINYGRLKALRLQLKYSVPEPLPEEKYLAQLRQMAKKRAELIERIKSTDLSLAGKLNPIWIKIP